MKTTKLKPRRMYINPSDMIEPYAYLTSYRDPSADRGNTLPVAVVPLDDPETLIVTAAAAHYKAWSSGGKPTNGDCMRAALAAIGVLPKQRAKKKGRA